jgi:hypothetical protein
MAIDKVSSREQEETRGGHECLYNHRAEAGPSPGSPASQPIWQETSVIPRTKIIFAFAQHPANVKRKYLKVTGRAWMSGGAIGYMGVEIEWGGSSRSNRTIPVTASSEDEGCVMAAFDLDRVCIDNGVRAIPSDAVVKVAIYVTTLMVSLTKVKAVVYGTSVLAD